MEKMNVGGFEVFNIGPTVFVHSKNGVAVLRDRPIFPVKFLKEWYLMQCDGKSFPNPIAILEGFNRFKTSSEFLDMDNFVSVSRDAKEAVDTVHYLNTIISRVNGYVEMVEDYISNREYIKGDIPDTTNMHQVAKRIKNTFDFYAAFTTQLYRAGYFTAA